MEPVPHKRDTKLYKFAPKKYAISLHLNEFRGKHAPSVLHALKEYASVSQNWSQYNRDGMLEAQAIVAIAKYINVEPGNVMLVNGADEALKLVADVYLSPGAPCIVPSPSYTQYARFAKMNGAHVIKTGHATDEIEKACKMASALVYIGAPSNPTGYQIPRPDLDGLIAGNPHCLFVIDGTYADYYDVCAQECDRPPLHLLDNVITVRSFSKVFGLADMRIGYIIATKDKIGILERNFNHKSVTGISKCAIVAVLNEVPYYRSIAFTMLRERQKLVECLRRDGCKVVDGPGHSSFCNFVCVQVKNAQEYTWFLSGHEIDVRDVSSYVPGCVRVTVGTPLENSHLIRVIDETRYN